MMRRPSAIVGVFACVPAVQASAQQVADVLMLDSLQTGPGIWVRCAAAE